MKALYVFPKPQGNVQLRGGKFTEAYRFAVPKGYVGFMHRFATSMASGGYGFLNVDGEIVTDAEVVGANKEGRILTAVSRNINPPVVVESHVSYKVYSPGDSKIHVEVDGAIYARPRSEDVPAGIPVYRAVKDRRGTVISQNAPVKVETPLVEKVRRTDIYEMENVTLTGWNRFWSVEGVGKIKELWVRSVNPTFEMNVEVDGKNPYFGDYAYYASRSLDSEDISAELRDHEYVVHLQDVYFKKHVIVMLNAPTPIRFSHAYVKYEVEK